MNPERQAPPDDNVMPIPWSQEAEQSVLGGLLLDNAAWDLAGAALRESDFYHRDHQRIWTAIQQLCVACKPADTITVFELLKANHSDIASTMLGYLNDISCSVPSAANMIGYVAIVRDRSLRRTLWKTLSRSGEIIRNAPEADNALDEIATLFASVERNRALKEPGLLVDAFVRRLEHWEDLASGEAVSGIPTRIPALDKALGGGLKGGKVVVVAARPSIGKTSLSQQIGIDVAHQGHTVLMLSLEMPEGDLVDRAASHISEVNLGRIIEGKFEDDDFSQLAGAVETARTLPFYVDDTPGLTLMDIRAKARNVQKRAGLKLMIVDYLQLCATTQQGSNRHHQIEEISRGLKQLAKELDITIILLSQINRDVVKSDREPTLADLKESGSIEEDADVVIFLHPKGLVEGRHLMAAIIGKNRQGRRGRVALEFKGSIQRWTESFHDVSAGGQQ